MNVDDKQVEKILAAIEQFRSQQYMNDSSSDVSSIQFDIAEIKEDISSIKKLIEDAIEKLT